MKNKCFRTRLTRTDLPDIKAVVIHDPFVQCFLIHQPGAVSTASGPLFKSFKHKRMNTSPADLIRLSAKRTAPTRQQNSLPLKSNTPALGGQNCFYIRHKGRNIKILFADIHYIEAMKNYSKISTKKGNFLALATLKGFEVLLPPSQFCRIHRAYVVSLEWITAFDIRTVYGPDQLLPIGKNYRMSLQDRVLLIGERTPNYNRTMK
jgi:DNA-binding LytR/AlgR family response regulator